jgi:hypothetical protein
MKAETTAATSSSEKKEAKEVEEEVEMRGAKELGQ